MSRFCLMRCWGLFTLMALCCVCRPASAETLHVGTIGHSPADEIRDFLPLAGYLAMTLKAEWVGDVKVVVAGSLAEMVALTRSKGRPVYRQRFPFHGAERAHGKQISFAPLETGRW